MIYDADYYLDQPGPHEFVRAALDELKTLRAALEALAAEPGQPHHAAAEALKILNRES